MAAEHRYIVAVGRGGYYLQENGSVEKNLVSMNDITLERALDKSAYYKAHPDISITYFTP